MSDQQPMSVNAALAQRIQNEIGQNVYLCYQCVKCTSGCPVGEFFDWQPNQIMRALQLGQEDIALQAETPWLCASCQTCTTRCPQGLDIAAIMEFITREARARGIESPVPAVKQFNEAFMREVRLWGRAYELGLMAELKLRTRHFTEDMDLGIKMMQKRKLALLPKHARRAMSSRWPVRRTPSPTTQAARCTRRRANSIFRRGPCAMRSTSNSSSRTAGCAAAVPPLTAPVPMRRSGCRSKTSPLSSRAGSKK